MNNQQKRTEKKVPSKKTVYLTFDDGPSQNTLKVLDILKGYGLKATFFVNGNNTDFGKDIYRRIVEEGHAIGNHTYSHNYSHLYASIDNYIQDTLKLERLIAETTGVKPDIIRFPGGSNNLVSRRYSHGDIMDELTKRMLDEGYQYFDWHIDSKDASSTTPPKEKIIKAVLSGIGNKKSAIILFHDSASKTTTVEALPIIIETLIYMDFEFEPLTGESMVVHFK